MRVLLLSALVYLTGVVLVLYFKPALMFYEDGRWKEFGLTNGEKYTVFPFWLFCIAWSIVSYGLVKVFSPRGPKRIENSPTSSFSSMFPTSLFEPSKEMKPGYYVLDKNAMGVDGIPRYIFIGEAPSSKSS